ncbi:unnamed protein product [Pleuronectes platessa]|uniref:Uncharacterized protein n=1 Tax=Pleuronectes platessa TaxID=8262 RepID=A0A9N7UZX2_PLEPL|nr:unnamed protein product [Pleuronectes platessa]
MTTDAAQRPQKQPVPPLQRCQCGKSCLKMDEGAGQAGNQTQGITQVAHRQIRCSRAAPEPVLQNTNQRPSYARSPAARPPPLPLIPPAEAPTTKTQKRYPKADALGQPMPERLHTTPVTRPRAISLTAPSLIPPSPRAQGQNETRMSLSRNRSHQMTGQQHATTGSDEMTQTQTGKHLPLHGTTVATGRQARKRETDNQPAPQGTNPEASLKPWQKISWAEQSLNSGKRATGGGTAVISKQATKRDEGKGDMKAWTP